MQPAHSSFDFCSIDITDSVTLGSFDENTTEQPNHASCVKQMVWFLGRHNVLDTPNEVVTPRTVLAAHVLLFLRVFLLAASE